MLYIKQHAADVALYGFCELSARHSLLFLCGAHMWLGASAINADSSRGSFSTNREKTAFENAPGSSAFSG